MKLRITPLNVITAIALGLLVNSFFQTRPIGLPTMDLSIGYQLILTALIVVLVISDFIFRFAFKQLKKIWIVELSFIVFTVILFLILQN